MAVGTPVAGTKDERAAASSTSTPSYPAVSAGDLLLGFGVSGASSTTTFSTTGTGFSADAQDSNTGDTLAPNCFVSHKIATGAESGTQSWPHGNVVTSVDIVGVPGVDTTTPYDPNVNGGNPTLLDISTASSSISIPSVTVTQNGSMLVYVISGNGTSNTATPPAGWTEIIDRDRPTGPTAGTRNWQICYKAVNSGATGTATGTWTGSQRATGYLLVLQPAATGSPASGTASIDLAANGASAAAGTATATFDLQAAGIDSGPASGTASLSLGAAGTDAASPAGSGSLTLAANGTQTASPTGTAALALAATGVDRAPESGTAALALAATGVDQAPATGSASVTLGATGSTGGSSPASGSGALALAATGTDQAAQTGTAALTLAATGTDRAATSGSGVLTLTASGAAAARGAGSAALSLLASGAAAVRAAGQALLTLLGVGAIGGPSTPYIELVIPARIGTLPIGTVERTLPIPAALRTLAVPYVARTLVIPAVTRTLEIPEV